MPRFETVSVPSASSSAVTARSGAVRQSPRLRRDLEDGLAVSIANRGDEQRVLDVDRDPDVDAAVSERPARLVGGVQRWEVAQGEGGRPDDQVVEGRDRLPAPPRAPPAAPRPPPCRSPPRGERIEARILSSAAQSFAAWPSAIPPWWRSPRRRWPAPRPPPCGRRRRRCGCSGRCRRARRARHRARPRAAARRACAGATRLRGKSLLGLGRRGLGLTGPGAAAPDARDRRPMRAIGSPSAAVSPASTTISSSTPSVSAS